MALDVIPGRPAVNLGHRARPALLGGIGLEGGCRSAASAAAPPPPCWRHGAAGSPPSSSACRAGHGALLLGVALAHTAARRGHRGRAPRTLRRAREDIPSVKLANSKVKEAKQVLPYVDDSSREMMQWPQVLDPMKRDPDKALNQPMYRQRFTGVRGRAVRQLMQTYLRMQDVGRILRLGMQDPEGDGRGWAAVALVQLKRYKEAAKLAAGHDGQTPCGYQTLRYVAHALAKAGALEAAMHLSKLQRKCGRTQYITAGSREIQSILESSSLYLQATAQNMPNLLAAHGAQVSMKVEEMLEVKDDILALTPHRRFLMLTEAFNQLIRWYGRARLVPQALRACEIMNELGIPRNDMTIHFLSRGAAQQYKQLKRARRFTQAPPDRPGMRPEVVFIGRTNSGKSAMINALFSCLTKVAPSSKTRAWTRYLDFYEVNRDRAGLPHFMMVDTPGLGHADVRAYVTKSWPELIYTYLRKREALRHVFHLCDARNKKLLPADKQLIHLLARAQRRRVRYTIVITKIDVCTRQVANNTAKAIREELGEYFDVDIMFASARSLRGVDQLWSKIWMSVTETPRGRKHRALGANELARLQKFGVPKPDGVAEVLGLPKVVPPPPGADEFDSEEWEDDVDLEPTEPGQRRGEDAYFSDQWGEELLHEQPVPGQEDEDWEGAEAGEWGQEGEATRDEEEEEDDDEDELGELELDDEDFERSWRASEADAAAAVGGNASGR